MKSIIITFIASFLMLADLNGQWEIVRNVIPPTNISMADVCFINKETGFMVRNWINYHGTWGSMLSTNDGGKSWMEVFRASGKGRLNKCIFTNNSIGFITWSGSGFYQTSDGGVTWIKNGVLPHIYDLFFVNENTGFAATDTSIYKTTNGSGSWQKILNCNTCKLSSIFFFNDNTGWAVGESGLILRLTEKGTSEKIASGTTLPLKKVFFIDRNTGWIAGGYNNTDGLFPVLLKTINGGESWSKIDNINWLINDFYFRNNQDGWAVGSNSTGKGIIVETIDGGNTWSVQVDTLRVPLKATDYKDGYGWAIGDGLVLKKDFSVITWIKENNELYNGNTILFQNYPNPSSMKTAIRYQLQVNSNIELSVYDLFGRKVSTLVKEQQQAGRYEVEWNAERVKSGIYFYELKVGQSRQIRKIIVQK